MRSKKISPSNGKNQCGGDQEDLGRVWGGTVVVENLRRLEGDGGHLEDWGSKGEKKTEKQKTLVENLKK